MTSRKRADCPPAETLALAASGDLGAADRARIADHIASCADCAEEFQLIRPLQPWAERSAAAYGRLPAAPAPSWQWLWQVVAATLVLVSGALMLWNANLRQERTDLIARASVPAPVIAPAPVVPAMRAEVNVPIVDLQTDSFRSGAGGAVPAVSASAPLVTLIFATDLRDTTGSYRLAIIDATGKTVWSSDALTMTAFNTFTVALSPRDLGAGLFRLELSRPGGSKPVQSYQLRIEEGTSR